jgi:hypothetical protein
MSSTRVVCLRTHFWDARVAATFTKLQADLGAGNVFCIFDVTSQPSHMLPALLHAVGGAAAMARYSNELRLSRASTARIVTMTEADCDAINAMHSYGKVPEVGSKYRGESHVVAMAHALSRDVVFDYLYLIEYDVHCHGSWRVPLDACDRIASDFMAKGSDTSPAIRTGARDPSWCWWPDRFGPEMQRLRVDELYGCFFPLTRYSRTFLEVMSNEIGRNSGYCEVFIPTLCVRSGLVYKAMPESALGVFRFFNPMSPAEFEGTAPDNLLYHPVKWT